MKAALFAVTMVVLSVRGSEGIGLPIGPSLPGNTASLLNAVLSAVKDEIQLHFNSDAYSAEQCQVLYIEPDMPDVNQVIY